MSRTRAVREPDNPEKRAELARWHRQLGRAFKQRRCWCGAPALSVRPGNVEQREGPTSVLLARAIADQNLCVAHFAVAERKKSL